MIVQALVTEFAVEAFDVGVLCGLAGRDELQIHTAAVSPAIQCAACEFGSLVGANRTWQAAELADRLEHPGDVASRDSVIDNDVEALASEIIDDGQALDATAIRQRIHDE